MIEQKLSELTETLRRTNDLLAQIAKQQPGLVLPTVPTLVTSAKTIETPVTTETPEAVVEKTEKRGRGRPRKDVDQTVEARIEPNAEKVAPSAAAAALLAAAHGDTATEDETVELDDSAVAPDEAEPITIADVRPAIVKMNEVDSKAAKALVAKYGSKLSDIPFEKLPDLLAAANAFLKQVGAA